MELSTSDIRVWATEGCDGEARRETVVRKAVRVVICHPAECVFIDDQFDVALDIRSHHREVQAHRRPRLVATDEYAQPIAGLLRIVSASLDGPVLLAGKFG